ncbi:HAD family phosphatase [Patescibacteria group bacterium]|nr:HAD family phosphatase [Patescibacteria group bacterium]MBU1931326.1 HAD family phosphatase [Patescibacteria group bacterium]
MIKAVFFDLDETLIDASLCHSEASRMAFKKFDINYDEAKEKTQNCDFCGMRIIDIIAARLKALKIPEQQAPLKKIAAERERIFLKLVTQKAKLLPGARQALVKAKVGTETVAVVSSGTRKYIKLALKQFKLEKYVDFIVGSKDVKRGKPFPDCYQQAYQQLRPKQNIKKNEVLVVEDSANGVKAAKTAGLKILLVSLIKQRLDIKPDWQLVSLEKFDMALFN